MKLPNLRWWIAALLLLFSIKNYVDRQMFSLLAPTIQADLHMGDQAYANVLSVFFAAYTVAYLLSGRIVDALGARVSLSLFLVVWSVASAMTGWARSAFSMACWRGVLGLGEAGGYTASPKVVSEWFPEKERGTAVSFYAIGASLGATLAPVIVITFASRYGWRAPFLVSGLLGVALVVPWCFVFRPLKDHPWVTPRERTLIAAGQPTVMDDEPISERERWHTILSSPVVWSLMLARLLTDPVWFFFQFWLPKYFHSARGFSQSHLSSLWLIFLAADVGYVGGGFASDWMVRRGMSSAAARRRVMVVAAVLVPLAVPLIPLLASTASVFAAAMVVAMAHTAWLTCNAAYVMDLVPRRLFSTIFGVVSAGSSLGGIMMNQAVAWAVTHWSYDYCFYAMVLVHPLALVLIWRFARYPMPIRKYANPVALAV